MSLVESNTNDEWFMKCFPPGMQIGQQNFVGAPQIVPQPQTSAPHSLPSFTQSLLLSPSSSSPTSSSPSSSMSSKLLSTESSASDQPDAYQDADELKGPSTATSYRRQKAAPGPGPEGTSGRWPLSVLSLRCKEMNMYIRFNNLDKESVAALKLEKRLYKNRLCLKRNREIRIEHERILKEDPALAAQMGINEDMIKKKSKSSGVTNDDGSGGCEQQAKTKKPRTATNRKKGAVAATEIVTPSSFDAMESNGDQLVFGLDTSTFGQQTNYFHTDFLPEETTDELRVSVPSFYTEMMMDAIRDFVK